MIPLFKVFMNSDCHKDMKNILESGMITQATQVTKFENMLKEWFNYKYILTLNSATSGLTLAIRLLNLKDDDEILSTPLTCTATNWAILANNKKIKWVDVDKTNCNMDLDDLKIKITEKTKAVVLVHWGGYPINLDKLNEIKKYTYDKYGFELNIIEDCAHSFGSEYKGNKIGTSGNICVFSLQAIKHLTTGDGGLIFLPNEELYNRAKLLRWYGIDREKKYISNDFRMEDDVKEWGYKYHMNDINATIGISNLPYIKNNIDISYNNCLYYNRKLKDIKQIELMKYEDDYKTSGWLYTIKVQNKNKFMKYMEENNIMTSQVHKRNDLHSCVKEYRIDLPNVEELEKEIICIPCGWWITKDIRKYIVKIIHNFYNNYNNNIE